MNGRSRALYVETLVRADIDDLWRLTQDPSLHPRWDLRFSAIEPLGVDAEGRSRFRYERRLPLHRIVGTGVSIGERTRPDGTRTSALAFATEDRLSPLAGGRGYWRYVPTPDGVRFITGYDYVPGFGRLPDVVLRPLVHWMTAWSFDRLRIWAETGVPPERWPLVSVLAWWKAGRPRATRCRVRSPREGAMAGAPATLERLT
ncbi:SRPBCC family protein [Herbiconiux liangxiaofengii]|uniref:SRPBCC family protein n=1 Tax=Herbiconiux liangxiaofengii TaxID=3342795 RepID=UPI0035BAF4DB